MGRKPDAILAVGAVLSALVALSGFDTAAGAASPSADRFQPHRASYELLLEPGGGDGSIASAGGRLDFEWADACDGWAVKQRTRVVLGQSDGGALDFGWALTTWEAKDGLDFDFVIQRYQDGEVYETVRGEAYLEGHGAHGQAVFEEPVARTVELPDGTVFPTDHTFRMLDAAAAGELPVYLLIFDGASEEDGLAGVSTASAGRVPADRPTTLGSDLLADSPSHRLVMAYYPPYGEGELPDTEVSLRVFPNGVAESFVFDYGDFALRARLTELEALPRPEC
jgi:hypothetical protein